MGAAPDALGDVVTSLAVERLRSVRMSVSLSARGRSALVERLRAAGCVFAEDEARVLAGEARTEAELDAMAARRAAGEPLEHVVGWADFCGLRVAVDPGVFVPRRRSEHLVDQAVALIRPALDARPPTRGPLVVVDLCCGSGAVGLAVTAALTAAVDRPDQARLTARPARPARATHADRPDRPDRPGRAAAATGGDQVDGDARDVPAELHAVDIDPAAVRCARRNLAALGGHAHQGDLDEPLPATLRGRVDLLIANAPYVPTGDIDLLPADARDHEPRPALDGGRDGLDLVRRVIAATPRWLAPDGHLLVETSASQAPQAAEAVTCTGLVPRVVTSTDLDATAVAATRPPRPPAGHAPPHSPPP